MRSIGVSTIVKLVVASLIVGFLLALFGLDPFSLWRGLWRSLTGNVQALIDGGFRSLGAIVQYVILGAVIVVPIWIVREVLRRRGRRRP